MVSSRLDRLEEASSYTDRSVEALTQQLVEVDRVVRRLAGRVAELERKLADRSSGENPAGGEPDGGADGPGDEALRG